MEDNEIGPNDEISLTQPGKQGRRRRSGGATVTRGNHSALGSAKFIAAYLQLMGMVAKNYQHAAVPPKIVHV